MNINDICNFPPPVKTVPVLGVGGWVGLDHNTHAPATIPFPFNIPFYISFQWFHMVSSSHQGLESGFLFILYLVAINFQMKVAMAKKKMAGSFFKGMDYFGNPEVWKMASPQFCPFFTTVKRGNIPNVSVMASTLAGTSWRKSTSLSEMGSSSPILLALLEPRKRRVHCIRYVVRTLTEKAKKNGIELGPSWYALRRKMA